MNCKKKGDYFLSENDSDLKYIITDLKWFSKVLDILSNSQMKSDDYNMKSLIGKNVPIWTREKLAKELNNLTTENKVQNT